MNHNAGSVLTKMFADRLKEKSRTLSFCSFFFFFVMKYKNVTEGTILLSSHQPQFYIIVMKKEQELPVLISQQKLTSTV